MLVASNMAIMAFSMSGLFYPIHNVAHAVGGQLRVPHGEANAVLIPILMDKFPKHYLNCVEVLADAFGFPSQGKTAEEIIAQTAARVRELQKECGVNDKFDQSLDEGTAELMYWAIKFDPSGLFYPLPDDVIRDSLKAAFA